MEAVNRIWTDGRLMTDKDWLAGQLRELGTRHKRETEALREELADAQDEITALREIIDLLIRNGERQTWHNVHIWIAHYTPLVRNTTWRKKYLDAIAKAVADDTAGQTPRDVLAALPLSGTDYIVTSRRKRLR